MATNMIMIKWNIYDDNKYYYVAIRGLEECLRNYWNGKYFYTIFIYIIFTFNG